MKAMLRTTLPHAMLCVLVLIVCGCGMVPENESTPTLDASISSGPAPSEWDASTEPNYYRIVGPAETNVFVLSSPGVTYGNLDALGRATYAEGFVTASIMEAGIARPREDLSGTLPSGWGTNAQVDIRLPTGEWYRGYFWNRSHLLAKSLGGDDEVHNLVTGTRTQNVGANNGCGGMAYCEKTCRDWLGSNPDGHVCYHASAAYIDNELVPRSVFVDMRSSDGEIDQQVEVFNAALGFSIDYATGTFESEGTIGKLNDNPDRIVVVSESGKAYHHDSTCSGLREADPTQLREVTLAEAQSDGKHACSICGG